MGTLFKLQNAAFNSNSFCFICIILVVLVQSLILISSHLPLKLRYRTVNTNSTLLVLFSNWEPSSVSVDRHHEFLLSKAYRNVLLKTRRLAKFSIQHSKLSYKQSNTRKTMTTTTYLKKKRGGEFQGSSGFQKICRRPLPQNGCFTAEEEPVRENLSVLSFCVLSYSCSLVWLLQGELSHT